MPDLEVLCGEPTGEPRNVLENCSKDCLVGKMPVLAESDKETRIMRLFVSVNGDRMLVN